MRGLRFDIHTAMAEILLQRASEKGIRFGKLLRADKRTLRAWVNAKDAKVLSGMLDEFQIPYRCVDTRVTTKFRARTALSVFLAAGFFTLFALSSRIWFFSVSGADSAQIEQALYEMGISTGIRRAELDCNRIRGSLEAQFPDYAFFGVKPSGVYLLIQAVEADKAPEVYRAGDVRSLYASADGVIVSVHVAAGSAVVKAGDTVKKGDLLIKGEERRTVSGEVRAVRAEGSVIAKMWTEGRVVMPLRQIRLVETGREVRVVRLVTPFFTYGTAAEDPFEYAVHAVKSRQMTDTFIPVTVQTEIFREADPVSVLSDEASVQSAAQARAIAEARKNAPAAANERDLWTEYQLQGENATVRAVAEWTMEIALNTRGG